ncbi:MAG: hypothetical protein RL547_7, partial [Actinomycetota bacterium]
RDLGERRSGVVERLLHGGRLSSGHRSSVTEQVFCVKYRP